MKIKAPVTASANISAWVGALTLSLSAMMMTGCATSPDKALDDANASSDNIELSESESVSITKEAPALPSRPFEVETLYALLVAEIAGDRQRYDIALGNYMQEAERTRDPGVTARAARIARFLDENQAMVKMALLWSEIEPENPEALFMGTNGLIESGRLSEAFELSERLLKLGSRPLFLSIANGATQITDTQREQLLGQFDALLTERPADLQLLVCKGMILQQQNKLKPALAVTQEALAIKDDDMQAAVLEAKLLFQMNRSKEALQRLVALLERNPNNQRLRLQYARLLANIDMAEAQNQFQLLSEQSPSDPDMLFSLGLVAQERRDFVTAEQSFLQLLQLNQRVDSAHFYLGQIEESKNNPDGALEHYQAVKRGADFLPALNRTINILAQKNQLDEVSQLMENYRQALPMQTEQLYLLEAQALANNNHLESAQTILNDALEKTPENTDLLFTRAMVKEQRGLYEESEIDFRAVLKYQPNNASALNALGYGMADRGNEHELDEALQLITQALNIRPDDPAIIDSMGWVQFRLGNYDEALLRLREAFKAFPDHEVAAHLGEVLWVTGNKDQARIIWQEGVRLNPTGTIIPETVKRLTAEN